MKKCPDCRRELDKYGIACQYCGKVEEARELEKKAERDCNERKQSSKVS